MVIKYRKLTLNAIEPYKAHEGDAGFDLFSRESYQLHCSERALIHTGIAIAIPDGWAGFIQPKSGLAIRRGITVLNSPGLIDSGFRGEIGVVLYNTDRWHSYNIEEGDKIAQLVIIPIANAHVLTEVHDLPESARGKAGFGSTGVRLQEVS